MSSLIDHLKAKATPANRKAIEILEARGFTFLHSYGYENALFKLTTMDQAMNEGRLFEFLQANFGIPLT